MKRIWVFVSLAACCAVLTALLSIYPRDNARVLLNLDSFNPMADLLEPYAENSIERLDPYQLGHQLPGLNGMAFVFGTQARPYQKQSSLSGYVPLYSATVVIAVNQNGSSGGVIHGWRTLLDSEAVVLIPDQGTEGGRLSTIALAQGLGAQEGDLTPALEAFRKLQDQDRLNPRNEYAYEGYRHIYNPDRVPVFDAVIMWDYQARSLTRTSQDWEIIYPEEGTLSVDCGFVFRGALEIQDNLRRTKDFLLSERGREALGEAGFSPLAGELDLSGWDSVRLTYNPRFRREVLSDKLYAPASVRERLALQSVTMLLFIFLAQRILRRVPQGMYRTVSFIALMFVVLWMLAGMLKTLTLHYDPKRFFWFATYISRHALPVLWYCMCNVHVRNRLPGWNKLAPLMVGAFLLTIFVMTNDFHNQVFAYALANPETWEHQYTNGWGYYLSLFWSFSLIVIGVLLLFRQKLTRQQKRQFLYAGIFLVALAAYQALYIFGVKLIIDFDIPTTVGIFILVFVMAVQQERFMGASLLALPIFHNSPHAIAVSDGQGKVVYRNEIMEMVEYKGIPAWTEEHFDPDEIVSKEKVYKPSVYTLDLGRALILEDITDLKRLERSLEQTHIKLDAIRKLLIRQADETRTMTGRIERERYSQQMELLLEKKLEEVRQSLRQLVREDSGKQSLGNLRRIRLMIGICHQRLRVIIRSLETHPIFPAQLVEHYATGIIKDGQRAGLDGVLTASVSGNCPSSAIPPLLEVIDSLCLYTFDTPGSSLICHIEANEASIALRSSLSWEDNLPSTVWPILPDELAADIKDLGGQICQDIEEDCLLVRLNIPYVEVQE